MNKHIHNRACVFFYTTRATKVYASHNNKQIFLKKLFTTKARVRYFSIVLENIFSTCPGAHPVSYKLGTGSLPGRKRPGRGVDHPPPSSAEVKEREELYIYSPSGTSWRVLG